MNRIGFILLWFMLATITFGAESNGSTIALWLFDEPAGLYPSHAIDDAGENDYVLVIGPGGQLVAGKFGNALTAIERAPVILPPGEADFGLSPTPKQPGRTMEPMTWANANFCALMTSGENHLRKEVGFARATHTKLNLGEFDWTVEFWYKALDGQKGSGCLFEIGPGPRGENDHFTRLILTADRTSFIFENQPSAIKRSLKTNPGLLMENNGSWHHLAFVYAASDHRLSHYIDGQLQDQLEELIPRVLDEGDEDYMSVGRDGLWQQPFPGAIDELRFSAAAIYKKPFTPPASFASAPSERTAQLKKGPPPLLAQTGNPDEAVELMDRRHLFFDDALLEQVEDITFTINPPRKAERVIDNIKGPFRKHLTVVEDRDGLIRIYNSIHDDYLAVRTSKDGIHFEIPDMGKTYRGQKNIVIHQMVGGLGNPFIDANGPPEERWKYISGYHRRGIYVFTSPDGYRWKRYKTALLPFRSGTQSCTFYDDQRQLYVGFHRTGIFKTPAGATKRGSVRTETADLFQPIPFQPLSQEDYRALAKELPLREPLPWYLDNGPLTPGGFGLEFPPAFMPLPEDPVGTDLYVTKAQKYPWAPDTYLAFPITYFHYEQDGPATRQILMDPRRGRGSGPVETQLSVSRDGVNWKRFARPTYVGIGMHEGRDVYTAYIADGMVRRGDEIWQYYFGENQYHSAWKQNKSGNAVYRLVQRLDGFVSADAPYDREATMITKPILFKGNRLLLNIDTDATGYAQVGFLDKNNNPLPGFSVDDCIYINGDFINTAVEWFPNWKTFRAYENKKIEELSGISDQFIFTKDVSSLQGREVKLVFRLRGCKLYAMQFTTVE